MNALFHDIRTTRCRITPLAEADSADLAAITDASVTGSIHFLSEPFTADDARALIRAQMADDRFFGIRSREDGTLLGVIGVHCHGRRRTVEIGYWMAAPVRGQGYAREALQVLIARLALQFPDSRIVAECHPDNARSQGLLQRVGFTSTGQAGQRPGRVLYAQTVQRAGRIDVC